MSTRCAQQRTSVRSHLLNFQKQLANEVGSGPHTLAPLVSAHFLPRNVYRAHDWYTFVADTCAYTSTLPQPAIEPTREQPCEQDRSPPTEHRLGTAERKGVLIAASLGLPTFAPKAEDTGAFAS